MLYASSMGFIRLNKADSLKSFIKSKIVFYIFCIEQRKTSKYEKYRVSHSLTKNSKTKLEQ